jgi:hypothetical protein
MEFADRAAHRLRAAGLDEGVPAVLSLRVLSVETFEAAKAHGEDAMRHFRAAGVLRHLGWVEANLALFALEEDRFADALGLAEVAAERWVAARADSSLADARGSEAYAALGPGDLDRAAEAVAAELRICRRIGYFELLSDAVLSVAALAAVRRDVARSAFFAGAAAAVLRRRRDLIYMSSDDLQRRVYRRYLEPARRTAPAEWDRVAEDGERLSDHAALDAALAYCTGVAR